MKVKKQEDNASNSIMIPVLEQQMLTFYVSPEVIPKIQSLNEEYTDTLEIEEENDIQEEFQQLLLHDPQDVTQVLEFQIENP